MGKIEKWHFLPSHCRYVDKTFIEMFLEMSTISYVFFGPLLLLLVAMETEMPKKMEKIRKKLSPLKPLGQ